MDQPAQLSAASRTAVPVASHSVGSSLPGLAQSGRRLSRASRACAHQRLDLGAPRLSATLRSAPALRRRSWGDGLSYG